MPQAAFHAPRHTVSIDGRRKEGLKNERGEVLKAQEPNTDQRIRDLEAQLQLAKNSLVKIRSNFVKEEEKSTALTTDVENLKAELKSMMSPEDANKLKKRINELEESLEAEATTVTSLRNEISSLQSQLNNGKELSEKTERNLRQEISSLEKDLQEHREQKARLEIDLRVAQEKLTNGERERDAKKQKKATEEENKKRKAQREAEDAAQKKKEEAEIQRKAEEEKNREDKKLLQLLGQNKIEDFRDEFAEAKDDKGIYQALFERWTNSTVGSAENRGYIEVILAFFSKAPPLIQLKNSEGGDLLLNYYNHFINGNRDYLEGFFLLLAPFVKSGIAANLRNALIDATEGIGGSFSAFVFEGKRLDMSRWHWTAQGPVEK